MIKILKKKQFFWDLIGKLSKFYPEKYFKKLPDSIIIEMTNSCNLKCLVCPTNLYMSRSRGLMDFKLFKSIIDEFKNKNKKPRLLFNFAGEPLLHKEIPKFIEYAHSNGHHTYISTNVTILNERMSKDLILAGLDSIHLCIDGFSKNSQEGYRVGSNFLEVKENIENFLKIRKKLNRLNPNSIIQTLITSMSEDEIDELIEWAQKIGADGINLKSISLGSFTTDDVKEKYKYLLPKNRDFLRKTSTINKTVCQLTLNQAVIFWNGDLGLCCIDFNGMVNLPNIKEKGFIKTYFSDEVVRVRKKGFQKKFGLCQKCELNNADFVSVSKRFRK